MLSAIRGTHEAHVFTGLKFVAVTLAVQSRKDNPATAVSVSAAELEPARATCRPVISKQTYLVHYFGYMTRHFKADHTHCCVTAEASSLPRPYSNGHLVEVYTVDLSYARWCCLSVCLWACASVCACLLALYRPFCFRMWSRRELHTHALNIDSYHLTHRGYCGCRRFHT